MNKRYGNFIEVSARFLRIHTTDCFTLVELLVVIGIIAILTSLLLPALNQARQTANTITCGGQVRQITLAIFAYANDFNAAPAGLGLSNGMYNDASIGIAEYLGVPPIYIYPEAKWQYAPPITICPAPLSGRYGTSNPKEANPNFSYGNNGFIVGEDSKREELHRIFNPGGRLMTSEIGYDGWLTPYPDTPTRRGSSLSLMQNISFAFRHNRKVNLTFVDGHLEKRDRNGIPLNYLSKANDPDSFYLTQK